MSLIGKYVVYNGGTDSYSGCTNPDSLVIGKRYLVIDEDVKSWQTNLKLKGVVGEFNSVWFCEKNKKSWIAKAVLYHPIDTYVGKRIRLARLHENNLLETVTTSNVMSIEKVYGNIYKIETDNSVYITEVQLRAES